MKEEIKNEELKKKEEGANARDKREGREDTRHQTERK